MRYVFFIIIIFLFNSLTVSARDRLIVKEAKKEIVLSGYTRNEKSITISAEVSGRVLNVNYDVGQKIGDRAFIEIDPTFVDFQLKNTLSSLEKLEILIKKSAARVSYLEKEYRRIENLRRDDLATEATMDKVKYEFEQARFELEAMEKEKNILTTTLSELKERKKRHSVFAPKGLVVIERNVENGEVISPGTPLAVVSDYRNLVVPLSVSGEELEAIKALPDNFDAELEGQPVKVSIKWINPRFDEKSRKLQIELLIQNYTGTKRGGLKLTLPLHIKTEGVNVPEAAVTNRYENPTVTLKETGEVVQLLIIGESGDSLLVAEDRRLVPGTELVPAEK